MSTQNDGGPAFPFPMLPEPERWDGDFQGGMTLRDYFAAQAMQALILAPTKNWPTPVCSDSSVSAEAYSIADAMLRARDA